MKIEGKDYRTRSITKGLARHRMATRDAAKDSSDKAGDPEIPASGAGSQSDHDHGGQDGTHEVIQQIHSEHGPAKQVSVTQEGEHHSVETTHEDGHKHSSKGHPSAAHVHAHLGHAIGADPDAATESSETVPDDEGLEAMGLGATADD